MTRRRSSSGLWALWGIFFSARESPFFDHSGRLSDSVRWQGVICYVHGKGVGLHDGAGVMYNREQWAMDGGVLDHN